MEKIRYSLGLLAGLFILLGYLASQYAYFSGRAQAYAMAIDQPAIRGLSLFLLLAAIICSFIKADDGESNR
jgi:hypothetical protein